MPALSRPSLELVLSCPALHQLPSPSAGQMSSTLLPPSCAGSSASYMLCVPFLKILLNLNDKQAHATTVLVMSIISIPTLIVYISTQAFSFFNAIFLTFGVIVGGIIGSKILNKINNETLNIIFIILMLSVGIKMLF